MIRRIPYIQIKQGRLYYICPTCRNVIPRDLYKSIDWCPSCENYLNKTAKSIMKVYKELDEEFYSYFINIYKR